jgi:hypothetical protein
MIYMKYFIDFDGTICPNNGGPPQAACREVLRKLKECNNTIHIYSCRSNPDAVSDAVGSTHEMEEYLKAYQIPYDEVVWGKPFFNFYIDDRNIGVPLTKDHSVDWEQIKKLI